MPINLEDNRADLIVKIDKIIDEKLPAKDAVLIKEFLLQYYLGVSSYDLRSKSILDLYGALISHWHFIFQRLPGQAKLRVYNPQLEQHGWQSTHTVIEVAHDNKPFLLDSLRLALSKLDINIHLIIHAEGVRFVRDDAGKISQVLPLDSNNKAKNKYINAIQEAPIYMEIDRQKDGASIEKICTELNKILEDVDIIVKDWPAMLANLNNVCHALEAQNNNEIITFLHWLEDNHFTFIGYVEYEYLADKKNNTILQYVAGSGLGVLSDARQYNLTRELSKMDFSAREQYLNNERLLLGKTDTMASVHRPAYTDFVTIKIFNEQDKPSRLVRFVGLYTSAAYNEMLDSIPFIRKKIERVFKLAKFPKNSHDGKALVHIIETLPRDEIFQATDVEIFDFAIGILHLQERQRLRLFMRRDVFGRYFSCLVFVPREVFSSQLRKDIQQILLKELQGQNVTFDSKFSESVLARIHYIVRIDPNAEINYDAKILEEKIIEAARTWGDDLKDALDAHWGEEQTNDLFKKYGNAFPVSYREIFSARSAIIDIEHIENLKNYDDSHLEMSLYRPIEETEESFRFKLFRNSKAIPLSDIVPILERMGLRIISERPHEIKPTDSESVWVNDYCMISKSGNLDTEAIKDIFQDAFDAVWHGLAENDAYNRLVISAGLAWRDISILRAYYKYMWQVGLVFSQTSVEDALFNNGEIAKKLIKYFYLKFDPKQQTSDQSLQINAVKKQIEESLDSVASLNEDRIIRHYLGTMIATVRTNFFQVDEQGKYKACCSYKFDSARVPDLPLPKPLCEIFVYSPQVEGIHLRGDRVARGGLRWSDRHEDFRTEILGLMKAQQVKNAVIVPLGAKGGFIVKNELPATASRADKLQNGIKCYQTFVRGLLDLTDNYQGSEIIKPKNTVCLDIDDPYLVVAADKGTATFSDIANAISKEYNFWLGDAFASGGSAGYDHKKMAITARGAWESVKMHFQKFNIDVQTQSITVFGIGDMAGDVFGNGMLLSEKIKLIAAFNHMHIFFDPDPDPVVSFKERKRLFDLPGSGWNDYDAKLISAGGGVFERAAKKIPLSAQMQQILETKQDSMMPNELMKAILTMKVDLFFNGGIGTFVKAASERNAEVGDRANDAIRINGTDLNVKVVSEGGNLGFTQLARIEYAKKGGIINTDAIDNSAGVNCSDNEVNIKILLNTVVSGGDMTEKQRNELLSSMTSDVAELVLTNNIKQNEALTLTEFQAGANLKMHISLLRDLERSAGLDSVVEFLPTADELSARAVAGQGFTRPEIAVLMAYTKIQLKKQLLISQVPDDQFVNFSLINYFPKALQDKAYSKYMQKHRLKRAIIATQLSNSIINEMGINFIQRLEEESGSNSPDIACAYLAAREVFDAYDLRMQIKNLGCNVDMAVQVSMLQDLNRLIRRGTRWFLRNRSGKLDIASMIKQYQPLVYELQSNIDMYLHDTRNEKLVSERKRLITAGVPEELAKRVSRFNAMFAALDIAKAAIDNNFNILEVAQVYFAIGGKLKLGWFGEMINKQPVANHWEALARAAFRDDVDRQQRHLAVNILKSNIENKDDLMHYAENWLAQRKDLFARWDFFVEELKTVTPEFTMFAVALRELLDLSQAILDTE